MKLTEYQKQARAGREANIQKASFIERRLFYLNGRRYAMRLIRIFLLVIFLFTFVPSAVQAQTVISPRVSAILNSMTPEERVGQLFLVTFKGTDVSETSQIYDLLVNYRVGGVVLLAQNDNFIAAAPDAVAQAHALIENLQRVVWDTSITSGINPETGQTQGDSAFVPLLVGIAQEGNGSPTDQILNGLTPLPSEMAIGATWNT